MPRAVRSLHVIVWLIPILLSCNSSTRSTIENAEVVLADAIEDSDTTGSRDGADDTAAPLDPEETAGIDDAEEAVDALPLADADAAADSDGHQDIGPDNDTASEPPLAGDECNCPDPLARCIGSTCVLPDPVDCAIDNVCPEHYRCEAFGFGESREFYCRCDDSSTCGPHCPGEGFGEAPCPERSPFCWSNGRCVARPLCETSLQCLEGFACVRTDYGWQDLTEQESAAAQPLRGHCVPVDELPYERDYFRYPTCRVSTECDSDDVCRTFTDIGRLDEGRCLAPFLEIGRQCPRDGAIYQNNCYAREFGGYALVPGMLNCRSDVDCNEGVECHFNFCVQRPEW